MIAAEKQGRRHKYNKRGRTGLRLELAGEKLGDPLAKYRLEVKKRHRREDLSNVKKRALMRYKKKKKKKKKKKNTSGKAQPTSQFV